jgi:hypothetical protein
VSSAFRAFAGHGYTAAGCESINQTTTYQATSSSSAIQILNPKNNLESGLTVTNTFDSFFNVLRSAETDDANLIYSTSDRRYYWQTTVKQGSDPGAWAFFLNPSDFPDKNAPFSWLKIGEVAVVANETITYNRWFKKDQTADLDIFLYVPGYPWSLPGITTTFDTKTDDTDWEQLSISFTPTSSGIVPIYVAAQRTDSTLLDSQKLFYRGSATIS